MDLKELPGQGLPIEPARVATPEHAVVTSNSAPNRRQSGSYGLFSLTKGSAYEKAQAIFLVSR